MASESTYWRSLREFYNKHSIEETKVNEFLSDVASDFSVSEMSSMSRKQFLALLTASAAFAATGCNNYRDKGEIIPYAKKPEEVTPGVPNFYASTCTACSQMCGILIKTREGRPIKIDGNADHPINCGKICAKGQASILNLYDPYRLRAPMNGSMANRRDVVSWKSADSAITRALAEATKFGKEIAVITRNVNSPTTKKVFEDFVKTFPTTKVYSYQIFNDATRRAAWKKCYNTDEVPVIDWEKASVIVALESDFLGTDGMTVEQIRKFTNGRDIMKSKNFTRLYCVEGTMSLTGANADRRLRLRPDMQLEFVFALLNELLLVRRISKPLKSVIGLIEGTTLKDFAQKNELPWDILNSLANDLIENRGKAFVHVGNVLPEDVHIAANYLNEVLGNSSLYSRDQTTITTLPLSGGEEIESLINKMKSEQVDVIVHFDSNPVYHLPKSFGYEDALKSVPVSVSLVESEDETSCRCAFVLPIHHAFESWGDFQIRTGVISLQQPVIAPLYDTRQREAILLSWIDNSFKETRYHEYLMSRWEKEVYPTMKLKVDFKTFWYSSLHDGVVQMKSKSSLSNRFQMEVLSQLKLKNVGGYALILSESYFMGDGTSANNGWLQEMPDPISKVVWDNYASLSVKTARVLGVQTNDLIRIERSAGSVVLPVLVQPGQADNVISVSLGYGRINAGPIGNHVGFEVGLLSKEFLLGGRVEQCSAVVKIDGSHVLATTQEHHALDDEFLKDLHIKRKIIREATVEEYTKNPNFLNQEKTELFSIPKEISYNGVKWAMSIDLNKCIGCNACVAGCNVENNIPVVGKEQVLKGREMQWIRIDRYYSGTDEAPSVSYQPMLCQQCDNAPCENVCPVSATNHSPDGLNQMVYNRCVGTKYCSNNCPYKVRRFNFFNWRGNLADGYYEKESVTLVQNPEVAVRSRGVMEKCTFCIQRIMEERQHASEQGREIIGSNVKTACEEACPSTAIVFGDLHEPASAIAKYRKHELGYHVLEETNARPNVMYLARLRNV